MRCTGFRAGGKERKKGPRSHAQAARPLEIIKYSGSPAVEDISGAERESECVSITRSITLTDRDDEGNVYFARSVYDGRRGAAAAAAAAAAATLAVDDLVLVATAAIERERNLRRREKGKRDDNGKVRGKGNRRGSFCFTPSPLVLNLI